MKAVVYHKNMKTILILMLWIASPLLAIDVPEVHYSYAGNYKAYFNKANKKNEILTAKNSHF